ncbi:hypothetical protein L6261_03610 [Candidatus Parcubacteria bacterium]|nr:hypothetical protein [Candidatus Parcubacteria bacterium]
MSNKRTKTGQKKHDEAVIKTANWYKKRKYKVKADLPKEEKPDKIDGFIPDLIVKKGGIETIIEVETKKSDKIDTDQQKAFRKYANKSIKRKFKKKIV